jgi:hypothetical protein
MLQLAVVAVEQGQMTLPGETFLKHDKSAGGMNAPGRRHD